MAWMEKDKLRSRVKAVFAIAQSKQRYNVPQAEGLGP